MSKEITKIESKEVGLSQTWEDKLAKYAVEAKEFVDSVEEPGMKFFSTRNAVLSFDDVPIKHNTLICVVVAHCYENTLYTSSYDADDKTPPKCFSVGINGEEMKPHPECEEPQNETCKGCPNLEYRSGKGNAKACTNRYRLALLHAGMFVPDENPNLVTDVANYEKTKVGYLRVPPTSMDNYTKYIDKLQAKKRPPFSMFTKIEVVIDKKTMLKINFSPIKPIEDMAMLEALEIRHKEASEEIGSTAMYERNEEEEELEPGKPTKY